MVQDLYIGQGVTVGLNKNKILEGFGSNVDVVAGVEEGDGGSV